MEQLLLEDAVEQYIQWRKTDSYLSDFYLSIIRGKCKPVLRNYGLQWDNAAEKLLRECCEHYSIWSGLTFLSVWANALQHHFGVEHLPDVGETLESGEIWRGTGKRTYQMTRTSVEEKQALAKDGLLCAAIKENGSRKDED